MSNNKELIDSEVGRYINESLKSSLDEHLSNRDFLRESVLNNIKNDVAKQINDYLSNRSIEDIQTSFLMEQESRKKDYSHQYLMDNLDQEAKSASMLKMVMINLFVLSTVLFLIFNISVRPTFTTEAYMAIVVLYLSLGAFMLYIIRTSHFRTSVLLAIREDERNYYNALDYIIKFKNNNDLTEHDVDVIRMIMTNRSEREQKAQHPYEVILKGVSGTNIQFKGGKMQLGSKSSPSSDS